MRVLLRIELCTALCCAALSGHVSCILWHHHLPVSLHACLLAVITLRKGEERRAGRVEESRAEECRAEEGGAHGAGPGSSFLPWTVDLFSRIFEVIC